MSTTQLAPPAALREAPRSGDSGTPAAVRPSAEGRPSPVPKTPRHAEGPKNWYDRIEAFISRLSVRDNFWAAICSFLWLPLAFFSGIRMKQLDGQTFSAVLPFRRFNRNWYRAMAGGALLANSEIAGGMYVFGIVGGDYTVVCKHLDYRFLRPCFGPAVYRISSREDIQGLVQSGGEFNITVDMDVLQQASRIGERDKRVGQCVCTFHVTPKIQHKVKKARKAR